MSARPADLADVRRLEPEELLELRRRLTERCEDVATAVLGEPIIRTVKEWRWGSRNGSLALAITGSRRGLWADRAEVLANGRFRGGDMLRLVQTTAGSFTAAVERACGLTGYDPPSWSSELTAEQRAARAEKLREDRGRLAVEAEGRRAAAEALRRAEDERDITEARAMWDARADARGTPAEPYIISTRAIPIDAAEYWPAQIAWHPGQRALIAAATLADGTVAGVQIVRLTSSGHKRLSSLVKQTYGRLLVHGERAALRLDAWADVGNRAVLLHAEGIETAVTAWRASGAETWCALSSALDPQPGRINVIIADDDAEGSPRARSLARQVEAWRAVGLTVVIVTPWETPRGDRSDLNDVSQRSGIDAARARIEAALADAIDLAPAGPPPRRSSPATSSLPAYYPAPTEDRAAAKARQDSAITAHMNEAVRVAKARRELHKRRAEAFADAGEELTPGAKGAITKRLHRQVAASHGFGPRLPLPPRTLFSGSQGSGKTTVARTFASTAGGNAIWWQTAPTLDKAREELDAYHLNAGPDSSPAMLIRGRKQPDPQRAGHRMCDRNAAAEHVARAGLSVTEKLCASCPLREPCGYLRQRREADALAQGDTGAVFFMAADYAFLPAPAPMPDHAILDESMLLHAIERVELPATVLEPYAIRNLGIDTRDSLHSIRMALADPKPLAALRAGQIDRKELRTVARSLAAELERQTPRLSADMTDAAIIEALDCAGRGQIRQALALIGALRTEIDMPRDTLSGVVLRQDGTIEVSRRRSLRGLKHASLTVLDGTANVELSRVLYGSRLAHVHVPFDRLAHVIGTKGKGYSRQSITGEDRHGNAVNARSGTAAKLRGELGEIHARLPAGSMVCGTKRAVDSMFDTGAVPSDTPAAHFGALRGLNTWEHCPGGLFIGAERVSITDLESLARAYLADDPAPFVSMDHPTPDGWAYRQWPYKATRMRRMRDGSLAPVEVEVHPDPRVQRVHELIREAELVQAIDRVRSVWHRRQIVVANDLCLDLTYDAIYRHRQLVAGGNPVERAFLASGIVPHTPELLHLAHRTIFRTPKAAEHARKNYPQTPSESPLWDFGVVSFRLVGQRGPEAKATIDRTRWPDDAALIAAIEAFSGPLQSFQGVALRSGETPAFKPVMPTFAGWVPPAPRQPGNGAAPPSIMVHGPPDG